LVTYALKNKPKSKPFRAANDRSRRPAGWPGQWTLWRPACSHRERTGWYPRV